MCVLLGGATHYEGTARAQRQVFRFSLGLGDYAHMRSFGAFDSDLCVTSLEEVLAIVTGPVG